MSKKKYTCNWPVDHDGERYDTEISLTAKEAEPLLAVGAIGVPEKATPAPSPDEASGD